MKFVYKKIRYYYWLVASFIKKNFRYFVTSFILGFFLVVLFINFFPFITTVLNRKVQKIAIVGSFTFANLPDEVTEAISNPLLIINNKGEIIPILIKSYELLDNNQTYRFYLKPNLTWNNGKKFTAYDINYNFKGVEKKIVDETTIQFSLNQPLSTFPIYLTKPIFKDRLIGVAGLYELGDYVLKNGQLVSLRLLPNKNDHPHKIYRFYDTESKMINAYKKGEVNLIRTAKKNIADSFADWQNTKVVKTVNYNQILTIFFNNDVKLLSNREMRQTLVYATPVFDELGVAANGPISPLSWAHRPNLKKYTTDLDRATGLFKKLAEDKKNPELNFYTFYDHLSVAEQIKKNYEKMGLKINLKVLSYLPQDFDLLLTLWNAPQDPDQYYFWHSTQKEGNITNYKNVKIDKLLEDGRKTLNVGERKKIYADFQKNIMEDLPAYFISYPYVYTIEKK